VILDIFTKSGIFKDSYLVQFLQKYILTVPCILPQTQQREPKIQNVLHTLALVCVIATAVKAMCSGFGILLDVIISILFSLKYYDSNKKELQHWQRSEIMK
jgi:hypothetical protein